MVMELPSDLNDKLSQIFSKWLVVQSSRGLYGPGMPQVKTAMDEFIQLLKELLATVKKFSVIRKKDDLEIKAERWSVLASTLQVKGVIVDIKNNLEKLNVNSFTFLWGISPDELEAMFSGLDMPSEELDKYNGLKGFLQRKKVVHIEVDQLHFKLLKEDESIGTPGKETISEKKAEQEAAKLTKKDFSLLWEDYVGGKINKWDFIGRTENFLELAKKNPAELAQVLKSIVEKQKDIEAYIAALEQKLIGLGFTQEAIKKIKEKLRESKQVRVSEDELIRLRKLEREFQKTLEERVEDALREVKKLNRKLSDEKERINTMLRQSSQGVVVIDKEGKVLSMNGMAEKALGLSLRDGQQKTLKDIVRSGQVLSMVSDWQSETDEVTPKEVKILVGDDKARDMISQSSAVIENQDGKAIGTFSSLPETVAKEDLEKRRIEIIESLGHDLKTPIVAAKQSLAVLMVSEEFLSGLNEQQRELLNISKRNVERMERMVKTILDARQLEAGKVILRKESINISKLIKDAIDLLKSWASDTKIQPGLSVEEIGEIEIDWERIYQVISNLVSNALKFTPEGGHIDVNAKVEGELPDAFVRISVADSGIGIKKSDLGIIFNKYEQVSLQRPKGEIGLGLGLAICKSIVELHGGKIWAESEEGKGSTFIFTLPCGKKAEAES